MALVVKNPLANAGDTASIPGSGRSPGGGHSNPLQYSSLENPMDRGAWWATLHGVTESQTRLRQSHTHTRNRWYNQTERLKTVYQRAYLRCTADLA